LTEFLPVSSSAHLLIVKKFLQVAQDGVLVSVVLHAGTTFALIVYFFKDILNALRERKTLGNILIVTVITGAIGISGQRVFERLFNTLSFIPFSLAATGIILLLTSRWMRSRKDSISSLDAVVLGVCQGIAIIPGISRSGITIAALLARGVEREKSFRFSFLAAIPAVCGAMLLEAKNIQGNLQGEGMSLMVGLLVSAVSGFCALLLLQRVMKNARLYYFGYYCLGVAFLTFLFVR
jgi:undecaprenyl-diphosphatase